MAETARRAFIATLVAVAVVAGALALWKLKLVLALVFLGFIVASAMRPGVEALERRRVPKGIGVAIHYVALLAAMALFLWIVVPRALDQVQEALGNVPTSSKELKAAASGSTGIKHDILVGLERRLEKLPSGSELVHPAITLTVTAFEVLVGIFFVFATAAYWIFERDHAVNLVTSLVARARRRRIRDTWDLIDAKLGAFVRGQMLLIVLVATALSLAFMAIGLPYWILIGTAAGIVEIVPVIGPLTAGALAVGVGFTESWKLALAAGICVLVVRLLEDYIVIPRVLGHAVGLSPLLVLVSVTAVGLLFGGFYVLFAVPLAAVCATLVDVIVRGKDPAEEDVPAVLFPAKDAEA